VAHRAAVRPTTTVTEVTIGVGGVGIGPIDTAHRLCGQENWSHRALSSKAVNNFLDILSQPVLPDADAWSVELWRQFQEQLCMLLSANFWLVVVSGCERWRVMLGNEPVRLSDICRHRMAVTLKGRIDIGVIGFRVSSMRWQARQVI
jgi:hypothetical protein